MKSIRGIFDLLSSGFTFINPNLIALEDHLNSEDISRLQDYATFWNFYEGYHWEGFSEEGKPQVTENWCRRFSNKWVAAEFGSGFTFKFSPDVEETVLPFLNSVWEDNRRDELCTQLGQMKSVTGDAYIHIHYEGKKLPLENGLGEVDNDEFYDPFDLYDKGRIRLYSVPSSICFPRYRDGYDNSPEALESMTVVYPEKLDDATAGANNYSRYKIVKYVYTRKSIEYWEGKDKIYSRENPYGVIPIVPIRNIVQAGKNYGLSDLVDIIPLNIERNVKNSDISEILDYHTSPVTCVFGARVGQLERGPNKVWGGLPKDARVENLELKGDLGASGDYRSDMKMSLHNIAGMPQLAVGGEIPASNLSGSALQIAFMPLTDTINMKRVSTIPAFQLINKIILKIAVTEGLISIPKGVTNRDFYTHDVTFGDVLPKDAVMELEQIQMELKAGLETRSNAMKRLRKGDIERTLTEIEKDREENPLACGITPVILSAGQTLVNPETGEVISQNKQDEKLAQMNADNQMELADKNAETAKANAKISSPIAAQLESKPVGTNKEGNDVKINSGVTNKNPK